MSGERNREFAKFFLTLSQITYGVLILGAILSAPLRVRLLVLGIVLAMTFFSVAWILFRASERG